MHVSRDLKNWAKKIAKKVLGLDFAPRIQDFDMGNLFSPKPLLDEMEDASSGSFVAQPKPNLRERQYNPQPIRLQPDYSGDFLDKLRAPIQGKPITEAAEEGNIFDFDMPSEKLKHQEEPQPRILLDDYYEFNRPGQDVGESTLKDYWNRGWYPDEAPEISEDKWLRTWPMTRTANVISEFLLNRFPIDVCLDLRNPKVAKLLTDFEKSRIHTKYQQTHNKAEKPLNTSGVSVRVVNNKSAPALLKYVFNTGSGGKVYTTIFQFIPEKDIRDLNRLPVRVSCSCESFLFYGAQYNAYMQDYLYGPIVLKFAPARVKDPGKKFLVCKHILAAIPYVSRIVVKALPGEKEIKKLKKAPMLELKLYKPKEKIKIPSDLLKYETDPEAQGIVKKWEGLSERARKKYINTQENPEIIEYLAHKYPDTAPQYVIPRLKDLAKPAIKEIPSPEIAKEYTELARKWDRMSPGSRNLLIKKLEKNKLDMNDEDQDKMDELIDKLKRRGRAQKLRLKASEALSRLC